MPTLAERIDFVLGVDTHKHTHTAALVTPAGGLVVHLTVSADSAGYAQLLTFARERACGRRILGHRGHGQFWGRANHAPAGTRRVGRRDRPSQTPSPP